MSSFHRSEILWERGSGFYKLVLFFVYLCVIRHHYNFDNELRTYLISARNVPLTDVI